MIYKIEFNAKLGAWQLKINKYWFFWECVSESRKSVDRTFSAPMEFHTYRDAKAYVQKVGLDAVYRDYADRPSVGYELPPMQFMNPPTGNVTRPVSVSVEQP